MDQRSGPLLRCPWIEVMLVEAGGGKRLVCARLKGNSSRRIAVPKGWEYETSLTKCGFPVGPGEMDDRVRFVDRLGNLDVYEDLRSGKMVGAERVMVTGGGEESLKLELQNICFEVERLGGLRHRADPADEQQITEKVGRRLSQELLPRVAEIIKGDGARMPLAHYTFGRILRLADMHEQALNSFEAANKLGPGDIETVIQIFFCHLKLKNHEMALEVAREATGIAPLRADAWKLRFIGAYYADHPDEAIAALKEALLLAPDDEDCLDMLAQLQEEPPAGD